WLRNPDYGLPNQPELKGGRHHSLQPFGPGPDDIARYSFIPYSACPKRLSHKQKGNFKLNHNGLNAIFFIYRGKLEKGKIPFPVKGKVDSES
ncbi:MAG: hypothetical protein ACI4QP_03940, partial [Candidatus Enteromonas sp.]